MEKFVRNLFLGGTLLVGLAVSGLCLQTYAVTCPSGTLSGTTCTGTDDTPPAVMGTSTFSIKVDNVLTLSNVKGTDTINADIAKLATGNISATVTSNAKYTISLKADQPALTKTGDTSSTIPASSDVKAGTAGWGIKKSGASTYTALTSANQIFFTSTTSAPNGTPTAFEVGVGVSPVTPTGTYTTTVTVTAAAQS